MAKHRTPVRVYSVAKATPENRRPEPVELKPTPLAAVDGKFGSDEAKQNAADLLAAEGFVVNSITFAADHSILVYVAEEKVAKPAPRSHKPRRQPRRRR